MDSLHRQGSTRSASSATGSLNPVGRVTDGSRRTQKQPPHYRWSSYERLKLQPKDLDILTSKATNPPEHSHSLFYTPVRHRRAGYPAAGLPPRPPSAPRIPDSNSHGKLFQASADDPETHAVPSSEHEVNIEELKQPTGGLTSLQKLDQLLVEINSPLHSESAPNLTTVSYT